MADITINIPASSNTALCCADVCPDGFSKAKQAPCSSPCDYVATAPPLAGAPEGVTCEKCTPLCDVVNGWSCEEPPHCATGATLFTETAMDQKSTCYKCDYCNVPVGATSISVAFSGMSNCGCQGGNGNWTDYSGLNFNGIFTLTGLQEYSPTGDFQSSAPILVGNTVSYSQPGCQGNPGGAHPVYVMISASCRNGLWSVSMSTLDETGGVFQGSGPSDGISNHSWANCDTYNYASPSGVATISPII